MIVTTIISVTLIVLYALNVNYLYQLEASGCECAMDFKRKYILIYTCVFILYSIFGFVLPKLLILLYILPVMLIGGIVNVVYTLQYVNQLRKENCKCSESLYRNILETLAIVNAVTYGILILTLLLAAESLLGLSSMIDAGHKKKSSRK